MKKIYGYGMDSVCVKLGADEIGMRKEGCKIGARC